MKKYYWLLISLSVVLSYHNLKACDVCGCSVGGMYVGILPQFQSHFVGLRYNYRHFTTKHLNNNHWINSLDQFHTIELWGRFYPHRKIQIMGFIPINISTKNENNRSIETIGQGDMQFWVNYIAINTSDTIISWWKHNLMFGGGLKLPTGDFNHYLNDTLLNPNLQSGTGSWDFLVNANYTVRYKKAGMNLEAHSRFTTTNVHGYRFGHRFNGAIRFFLWTKIKKTSIVPSMALLVEYAMKDRKKELMLLETGGSSISPQLALDCYIAGKWMIGFSISHAAWEYLGNGMIDSGWKFLFQTSYLF